MLREVGLLIESDEDDRRHLDGALSNPAALPAVDQVELTNHCPMKCLMCPKGVGRDDRPMGFMDLGLFRELLGQIAQIQPEVKPLALHNLGESLLHPELDGFVSATSAAGLRTELSVNPALLTPTRYRQLVEAGIFRLVLSLDGLDAATIEVVRGPAARGAVALENLEALLSERERHPREHPEILVQMLRLKANSHAHAAFERRFCGLAIPGVSAVLKPLDANTEPALFPDGEEPRPYLCRAPWRTVVVLWDGRVVPCCHDARAEWVLGDLRRSSLAEIWAGESAQRLRERLRTGWPSPDGPCGRCAHRPDLYRRPSLEDVRDEPLHW